MRQLEGRPLASFGQRAAAFLLDLAIGFLLFLAASVATAYLLGDSLTFHVSGLRIRAFEADPTRPDLRVQLTFFEGLLGIAWWVAYFGLSTYATNGLTAGKRLLHIRVVSLVHERIGLWHAIERALGYGASLLEFGFGFVQYFVHPNRRTVHDRIAETIVIRDRR